MQQANYYYCYTHSPIGQLLLAGTATHLCLVSFASGKMHKVPEANWQHAPEYFVQCQQQLDEYFAGKRQDFTIPYKLHGTNFQQAVLKKVAKIPFGQTCAYSDIATQIDNPNAVRAVGMANARNNMPIIVPCHRVIGKNGSLTGFGGGLEVKSWLLKFEKTL